MRGRWLFVLLLAACDPPVSMPDAPASDAPALDAPAPDAPRDAAVAEPARYPADPRTFTVDTCRADQALGWSFTAPAACAGRTFCIDGDGRTYREGAPFIVRGVYHGGREVAALLTNCPSGAPCASSQPTDAAAYVDVIANAGINLVLEHVDALPASLAAALAAEPRVSVAHLLFGDPFTLAGHDALAAEIDRVATNPEVLFWMGPDEPDLNRTWPMATGIARLLRGNTTELDALLTGRYRPPGTPYLPATEPAHDPLGRPYASAVVIDDVGLSVASDVYDAILPVTYPFQEPYSRADAGIWSVERGERYAVPGVPMMPVLQMVELEGLNLIRPTPGQVRAQIFSSIALGADGAFYFKLAGDDPAFAGRSGWFAADDRDAWQAFSESHATWDSLVPVLYSDASIATGRHDVLMYRRFTRGDRRVLVIANPTPYDRPIDLDAIVARGPGEAVRQWSDCIPFTERAQIVPGYAALVLEVVRAAVTEPMPSADPLAGLRRVRSTPTTAMARDGAFAASGRLSSARSAHAAASVGESLVLAGGYQGGTMASRTSDVGDGTTFAAGASMPFAAASAAFGAGDTLVVAGGVPSLPMGPTDALSTCARWVGGSFGPCAPLENGPVYGAGAAFASGALFVLGGALHGGDVVVTTNVVTRYEPSIDAWRAEAHLTQPRVFGAAMEHAGVIYLVGGRTDGGGMGRLATEVVRYDLVERRFLGPGEGPPAMPLPTPRAALSCAAWDGHGYCVGGYDASGDNVATVERLDFADGTWTALPDLPEALSDGVLVVHQGALYYLGGLTSSFSDSDRVLVLR